MAEVRVGGIYIDITGRSSQFVRASRQAETAAQRQARALRMLRRDARRLQDSARRLARSMLSLRSAFGLVAGSAGLGLAVRQLTRWSAELVETSERTGIATRELQLLERAFQGDGASIEQTRRALSFLLRSFGEARTGAAEYRDEFEAIGIDVDRFVASGRSQFDLLLDISDGFQRVEDASTRARVAQALFGRAGQILIPVLQRGGEALRRSAESFAALGVVEDEALRRGKELEQRFTDLGTAIQTGFARGLGEAADELSGVVARLTRAAPEFGERLAEAFGLVAANLDLILGLIGRLFAGFLSVTVLTRVVRRIQAVAIAVRGVAGAVALLRTAAVGLLRATGLILFTEGIFQAVTNWEAFRGVLESVVDVFRQLSVQAGRAISGVGADFSQITGAIEEVGSRIAALYEGFDAGDLLAPISQPNLTGFEFDPLLDAGPQFTAEAIGVQVDEIVRVYESGTERIARERARLVQEARLDLALVGARAVEDRDPSARARVVLAEQAARERQRLTEIEGQFERVRRRLAEARAEGLTNQIVSLERQFRAASERLIDQQEAVQATRAQVEDTVRLTSAYRDLARAAREVARIERLRSLAAEVGRAIADGIGQAITQFNRLGDVIDDVARSLANLLLRNLVLTPLADSLTSGIRGLFGLPTGAAQHGGVHSGLTLVGERGPELVDFDRPARVYPTPDLAAALSGAGASGVNVVFAPVIQSADPDSVRRALEDAYPTFRDRVVVDIGEALRRPGVRALAGI